MYEELITIAGSTMSIGLAVNQFGVNETIREQDQSENYERTPHYEYDLPDEDN